MYCRQPLQFYTSEKETTPTDFRANLKKPPLTIQRAREKSPPQRRALLGEGKTAECVYFSAQFQLNFERLWPKLNILDCLLPRLLSNRTVLDFFSSPPDCFLSFIRLYPTFSSTKLRKQVVLKSKVTK